MPLRSFAWLVVFVSFIGGCTQANPTSGAGETAGSAKTSVTIKGSDTMVILGQRWAETYMKAEPGTTVQVTGGGSGTGIAALINGSTDICEASRPMNDKEKDDLLTKRKARAVEAKVALDALAVYVNEKNPIEEIALPTLAKIYLGEVKDWTEVGGRPHAIVLYGRENNSGTYGYFKEHVLANQDFAARTQMLAGTSAVAHAVKGDEYGVGYGGIAYLEGIKALKIKKDNAAPAIAPSLATAQDRSYPIGRFLYFYTAGEPAGEIRKFIDWVQGTEGQKVIVDVGYYPLAERMNP